MNMFIGGFLAGVTATLFVAMLVLLYLAQRGLTRVGVLLRKVRDDLEGAQ